MGEHVCSMFSMLVLFCLTLTLTAAAAAVVWLGVGKCCWLLVRLCSQLGNPIYG
jgi:hypothetical protein